MTLLTKTDVRKRLTDANGKRLRFVEVVDKFEVQHDTRHFRLTVENEREAEKVDAALRRCEELKRTSEWESVSDRLKSRVDHYDPDAE